MRTSTSDGDDAARLVSDLRARAKAEGFDLCRVAGADSIPLASGRLAAWLEAGAHGEMAWMESTQERRSDPRRLWPEARSVVVLGLNYGPERDPLAVLEQKSAGAISVYARGRDYHDVVKGKLKLMANWLAARAGGDVKVFVDTAPVMEKPLAEAAGLGWQGKHTNLVSRTFGSWLFLGTIFTTLELAADAPEEDRCGACRACLDACPTGAFPTPYRLDARRCISYLTIEHKGHVDPELRASIGNRIYGCDDCLAACPWNKFAVAGREAKLQARPELAAPALKDLAALDENGFRKLFAGGPIKRIGHARFLRNVMIAIGNSADRALAETAGARLKDPSPLVRAAAVWALRRLLGDEEARLVGAEALVEEADEHVRAEWTRALPDP